MQYDGPILELFPIAALPNRHGEFRLPDDGLYMIAAKGEHPHDAGVVQVVDDEAINALVHAFENDSRKPSGLLIDFDHNSRNPDKSSEAAGWITDLVSKPEGLYAKVRWSDTGKAALENGRFRFISPVWEAKRIDGKRARPVKLDSAGLTNAPNLKGLAALSNRGDASASAAATHNPIERTDTMKLIASKLGLASEASEDAIVAEIVKLQNRGTTAEQEVAALKTATQEKDAKIVTLENSNKSLLAAQVDADLDKFANRIKPDQKDAIRAQLLANRDATLIVLNGMTEQAGGQKKLEGGQAPADGTEDFKALVNRKCASGKKKTAAVAEVMAENPAAHVEWLKAGCPAV